MKKIINIMKSIGCASILMFCIPGFGQTENTLHTCTVDTHPQNIYYEPTQVPPHVLDLALKAQHCAIKKGKVQKKGIITIIDYSIPSSKKRLWVLQLPEKKVLFNLHVAHGKNTGGLKALHFSDVPESKETSIGVYVTGNTYFGHDGYSMRIIGLDKGFNDDAANRLVVMHGAWYVSPSFIDTHHEAGRSWGCPAVDKRFVKPLIDTIKGGSVLFSYFPENKWLNESQYLHCDITED